MLTDAAGSNEPRNFLLVGVDSAANLAQDDPAARRSRATSAGCAPTR